MPLYGRSTNSPDPVGGMINAYYVSRASLRIPLLRISINEL
jgi:hypothetical protein